MTRVGFLGPHGTFAEEALLTQPDLAAGEAVPFRDVPHVITAVERSEVDVGLVPIENSIEGSITVTLDTLAFDTELLVQREVDLPVSLHLCAPKGTKMRDITMNGLFVLLIEKEAVTRSRYGLKIAVSLIVEPWNNE